MCACACVHVHVSACVCMCVHVCVHVCVLCICVCVLIQNRTLPSSLIIHIGPPTSRIPVSATVGILNIELKAIEVLASEENCCREPCK